MHHGEGDRQAMLRRGTPRAAGGQKTDAWGKKEFSPLQGNIAAKIEGFCLRFAPFHWPLRCGGDFTGRALPDDGIVSGRRFSETAITRPHPLHHSKLISDAALKAYKQQ